MKNFVQPGKQITIPAPEAITSGQVVTLGGLVGIAAGSAAVGETVDVVLEGVFSVPKVSANVFSVGATVYVNSGGLATSTVGITLGHAIEVAVNGAAAVKVRLSN